MSHDEAIIQIRETALRQSRVTSRSTEAQALCGFVLGAAYALVRAMELRYEDRTGTALPKKYPEELCDLLIDLGSGKTPQVGQWLAGFFFNSALQRLAAIYHRALKMMMNADQAAPVLAKEAVARGLLEPHEHDALATVHADVNTLKHNKPGVLRGRRAKTALAVLALSQAQTLAERAIEATDGKTPVRVHEKRKRQQERNQP